MRSDDWVAVLAILLVFLFVAIVIIAVVYDNTISHNQCLQLIKEIGIEAANKAKVCK